VRRLLREKVSQLFPLPDIHWIEWIIDEQWIAATDTEIEVVVKLYERAVVDYVSVDIWLQWTEWEELLHEENYEVIRQRYEQAITQTGLHLPRGSEVWGAYIRFEKRVLEKVTEKQSQIDRIRKLYQRSLSIPLSNMSEVMDEYKIWEQSLGNDGRECSFQELYDTALMALEERRPFEEKISDSDPSSPDYTQLDKWWEYIYFEEKNKDIYRVRCLYERAIKNYFLVYDLWNSYIKYLQHNMKKCSKSNVVGNFSFNT